MRIPFILIVGLLCATPAWTQDVSPTPSPPGPGEALRTTLQLNDALARKALEAGDFKTARRYAQMVTDGDPGNLYSWMLLGAAQSGLQDWKAARGTYATALRLVPTSAEAHAGLGVAMGRSGDGGAAKHLAWLTARAGACGADCARVGKLRADVEAAIAAGTKAS